MQHEIEIPRNWRPRDYQMDLWAALEGGCLRAATVWHRRAGKDLLSLNWTVREAFRRPGLYWHILPTYNQGRKIVWNGMTRDGRRFLDYFPPEAILRTRDDEMTIWLDGGSLWQVVGTDDVDKLVGANPVGCIFSEYSLQNPKAWGYLRPILAENGGWALFIYTPRGRNHGYKLLKMAEKNPNWFAQVLTADDTKAISAEAIQAERDAGMPEEMIQQEFYCSFDAPLVGAYYGDHMNAARKEGRITRVPWEPAKPVVTMWDLGIRDATGIWFAQRVRREIRFIEYYQHSGVGLEHYTKTLFERPYTYEDHLVPHDANVKELGTGKSRLEIARGLGVRMRIVPKLPIEDGINAVRTMLPKCWFDEEKCATGLEALRQYRKEEIPGEEGPEGQAIYRDRPHHDWTSHAADAMRTGAVGWRDEERKAIQQPSARWVV